MKLLITGSHGQLGTELMRLGSFHDLLGVDQDELDITDSDAVRNTVKTFMPDAVINAAAYTAVDKAESERELAFAVNRDGPANLAKACKMVGIPLIHVSTDYVFDGCKKAPYIETDSVAPLSVYGASKWAGEEAVRKHCSKHVILRTSWVFSAHGNNFVKTMLRLGKKREALGVVSDKFGKPTAASALVCGIIGVLESGRDAWGTYHFCQPEPTTWHDFATAVFDAAKQQGMSLKVKQVKPITTGDYPTPAMRPTNSAMNCNRFESTFDFQIRPWQEFLVEVVRDVLNGSDV